MKGKQLDQRHNNRDQKHRNKDDTVIHFFDVLKEALKTFGILVEVSSLQKNASIPCIYASEKPPSGLPPEDLVNHLLGCPPMMNFSFPLLQQS